jgi:hypothetical protein
MAPLILALGAAAGLGCWLAINGLRSTTALPGSARRWHQTTAAVSVAELRRQRSDDQGAGLDRVEQRPWTEASAALASAVVDDDLAGDLRIVASTPEALIVRIVLAVLATVASLLVITQLGFPSFGLAVSWPVATAFAAVAAATVAWAMVGQVREQAGERRDELASVVGHYVLFVDVMVSGGRSIDGALAQAAELGDGWAWDELRFAVAAASHAARPPHDALAELGVDLNVPELATLARRLAHTQTTGSAVGPALRGLADHAAADHARRIKEADDNVTETMTFPQMVVLISLLAFFAIAAVHAILAVAASL